MTSKNYLKLIVISVILIASIYTYSKFNSPEMVENVIEETKFERSKSARKEVKKKRFLSNDNFDSAMVADVDGKKAALILLKENWLDLKNSEASLEKKMLFARQCVERLLCSEELFELDDFLKQNNISLGGYSLYTLEGLFENPKFGMQLAASTVEYLSKHGETYKTKKVFLSNWIVEVARTLSDEEYQSALSRLEGQPTIISKFELFRLSRGLADSAEEAFPKFFELSSDLVLSGYEVSRVLEWVDPSVLATETMDTLFELKGEGKHKSIKTIQNTLVVKWLMNDNEEARDFLRDNAPSFTPEELFNYLGSDVEFLTTLRAGVTKDYLIGRYITALKMGGQIKDAQRLLPLVKDAKLRSDYAEKLMKKGDTDGG